MAIVKRISDSYSIVGTNGNVEVSIGDSTLSSAQFKLNGNLVFPSTGVASITVDRGANPIPAISWNESLQTWQLSNDGISYDDITTSVGIAGVATFNTRSNAVTLLSSDVTSALGYTPVNSTAVISISNGGTGQTIASAAFNALSPITAAGDLIVGNGVNTATVLTLGPSSSVLTSNGSAAMWSLISSIPYPAAGIPNSSGSAWTTSYSTIGSGNVVLDTDPTISGNITVTDSVVVGGIISNVSGTLVGTSLTSIDSFDATLYRAAKYLVSASNGVDHQISEVLLTQDGVSAYRTAYGEVSSTGSPFITFYANIVGGNTVHLYANGTSSGNTIKVSKTYIVI